VKIKRILSIAFIFPVLLSSAICFSQYDFDLISLITATHTQVVEEDGDSQPEFRQNISIRISPVRHFHPDHSIFDLSQLIFQSNRDIQFTRYNQKHLAVVPSGHRFSKLGAVLI